MHRREALAAYGPASGLVRPFDTLGNSRNIAFSGDHPGRGWWTEAVSALCEPRMEQSQPRAMTSAGSWEAESKTWEYESARACVAMLILRVHPPWAVQDSVVSHQQRGDSRSPITPRQRRAWVRAGVNQAIVIDRELPMNMAR